MIIRMGQSGRRGFTLVEMLVVLALIGMLTAILGAALVSARRASIRLECQSKLSQIGQIIQQLTLNNAGIYPMLEQKPVGGTYPAISPPIPSQAGGTPWWVRVYQQTQGAAFDAATPGAQLPASMQMFHCRMAPALDISNLGGTLSYGLNFDTKRIDGALYQCSAGSNSLMIGPRAGQADDKNPDQISYTKIAQPSEFILAAEGDGYAITSKKASDAGDVSAPKPVVGRHGSQGNVLFADLHVELRWAAPVEAGDIESRNINLDTRLWTLPAD